MSYNQDVARALDFFCRGKRIISNGECLLCGEGVAPLWTPHPLGGPETTERIESRSTVEDLIRQRSGCADLKNVLLLVTPPEFPREQNNWHTVHCYRLNSRSHRGVTTVTQSDVRLIECHHGPDNYTIVYCTGYIEPEDAARNTPIKAEVFEVVQAASKAVRRTWYQGHAVRLAYRCSQTQLVGVSPPKQNNFGIRSLKQPKIPVRMPSHLAFVESAKEKQEKKERLRRNLKRSFYYTSQQNLPTAPRRRPHPRGGPILCKHFGFNFQKLSDFDKKRLLVREIADLKWNLRPSLRAMRERLAQTRKIKKTLVQRTTQRVYPRVEPDGIEILMQSRFQRRGSNTSLLPSAPQEFDPVIRQSTTTFTRIEAPLKLPPSFSEAAIRHLEQRLVSPSDRDSFSKLGTLVAQINETPFPREEDLKKFFHIAELLDFKMYVREESNFPGWPPLPGPRYRLECYVFDDRKEYLASICLLRPQLCAMARRYQIARGNFRFIDNTFELTPVPSTLTKWLKAILDVLKIRPLYDLLGELVLDISRRPAAVFEFNGSLAAIEN